MARPSCVLDNLLIVCSSILLITFACAPTPAAAVSICDVHTTVSGITVDAFNAVTFECNSLRASSERLWVSYSVTSLNGALFKSGISDTGYCNIGTNNWYVYQQCTDSGYLQCNKTIYQAIKASDRICLRVWAADTSIPVNVRIDLEWIDASEPNQWHLQNTGNNNERAPNGYDHVMKLIGSHHNNRSVWYGRW